MSNFADYVDEAGITRLRAKGGGGGSQTLAEVLVEGNDADGNDIQDLRSLTGIDGTGLNLQAAASEAASGSPGGPVTIFAQDSDTTAGSVQITAGNGDGVPGAVTQVTGGNTSLNGAPAEIVVNGGGDTDGGIDLIANGLLTLDGAPFGRAAHVADGSTVDQLRNALIAAGLMEAS